MPRDGLELRIGQDPECTLRSVGIRSCHFGRGLGVQGFRILTQNLLQAETRPLIDFGRMAGKARYETWGEYYRVGHDSPWKFSSTN